MGSRNNWLVRELTMKKTTLEEVFVILTGGDGQAMRSAPTAVGDAR
jgi:hypothetical protein